MAGGVFITGGEIIPTIDEVRVPNFQWVSDCTANPSTDVITTTVPHTQLAAEVVMITSTGTVPAPLEQFKLYRVITAGLGTNTLKLAENEGWHPPPENPAIDLTSAGTGILYLWIRPLDYIGKVEGTSPNNFLTGEAIGGRGAIWFHNAERHQYRNRSGLSSLPMNTDFWTGDAGQRPITKWHARVGGELGTVVTLGSNGEAELWSYGYPAKSLWGLGDLGVIITGGDRYYSVCGDCAFGNGGPPGGGGGPGGEAGGKEQIKPDKETKIEYRDKDVTNLVRRAQRASSIIENMRIVGPGVSGGGSNWQINPY